MPQPLAPPTRDDLNRRGRISQRSSCLALLGALLITLPAAATARAVEMPNIVVILSDDQGYADVGFNPHHPREVRTPHLDALAARSVVCTQGYTSGHVCSPTRAGLMTGRYQQRFGIYTAGEGGSGVPLTEKFFPQYLQPAGYVSGAFGKWHLGVDLKYNAIHRGFDEFYGFMGRGAHDYFDLNIADHPIYRGLKPIEDRGYLTTRITEESLAFIRRHRKRPFFLYVAYNAVHAPAQAPQEDIRRQTGDETRDTLMAMIQHLDDGVGRIVAELEQHGLFDNTLLFYLTDNGGAKAMHANNAPLRGFKQQDYEGGVRVPFLVSWAAQLAGRARCDVPVMSIDILPTALAAAGVEPEGAVLDGKNMLPALRGETGRLHDELFWSSAGIKGAWAVRSGDWKLVAVKDRSELFDLAHDVGEQHDLAAERADKVQELSRKYDAWLAEMAEPASGQPKRWRPGLAGRKKRDRQRPPQERNRPPAPAAGQQPAATRASQLKRSRPNVLLIVCDDLNTHVTTSGYRHIRTPAFERLAAAGTRFTRAYCQYPVCNPSRSSFLTGLYPESTGVLDNKTDVRQRRPGTVSLPQLFKQNGYWTGGVGKVFHGRMDQGAAAWHEYHKFDNERNPVIAPAQRAFEAEHGSIELPRNRRAWRARLQQLRPRAAGQTPPGYGPTDMTDAEHKDGKNVRQIARWLDEQAHGERPFFLACGIHKPHVPFWAPQKYFDMYPRDQLTLSPIPADDWDDIPQRALVRRFQAFGFELGRENDELRRAYTQAYHACITFVDAQIGLLLDALQRNGHWDDTVVVLTSDHGYHLGEHFMWGKVTLFEECARVPLIVRVPGVTPAGSESAGLVELVDLYPTLCELCGLQPPAELQGRSFATQLKDPAAEGRQLAYTVVSRGPLLGRSLRTARWRYAQWGDAEEDELYHLGRDPQEHRNLADDPQYADVAARLGKLLRRKATEAALHMRGEPSAR